MTGDVPALSTSALSADAEKPVPAESAALTKLLTKGEAMAHRVGDLVDVSIDSMRTSDGSTLEGVTISGNVVSVDSVAGTTTIEMMGDINGQSVFTVPNDRVRSRSA